MQKTKLLPQWRRLFKIEKGCVIISLILFASLAQAAEPIATLAAIQLESEKKTEFAGSSLLTDSFVDQKNSQNEEVKITDTKPDMGKPIVPTDNQTNLFSREILLTRQDAHANRFVTVQAGYCQIWDDKSMFQKISCGHQESGCAFVSANFSF